MKCLTFSSLHILLIALYGFAVQCIAAIDEACDSGLCAREAGILASDEPEYEVWLPVGEAHPEWMPLSKRLNSFKGKTVALVGGSFMARVTHPELKRLIQDEFPSAKILLLNEIGSAGVWTSTRVRRPEKETFLHQLREHSVDAVISGNGGCGLCTSKEMGSCIAAESIGIPSVMIAAEGFVEQAKFVAQCAGVRVPRVAVYPGSFAAHTEEELRHHTRETLWPQIRAALTQPFSTEELAASTAEAPHQELLLRGNLDDITRIFEDNGWTDGLPFIPPTKARVDAFLRFTDLPADTSLGEFPIAYRTITPRLVAIQGVMAGCPPEFMPILLALSHALKDGNFRRTLTSTHAWTPYCWVNGPMGRQLKLEAGQGAISAKRNAQIGRFLNLALCNLGGYAIQENRMGTFGYLMPWCLMEDEEACVQVGWEPWHQQHGYPLNSSSITAASALSWGNNLAPASSHASVVTDLLAWDVSEKQQFALGSGKPFVYRTILLTPPVARILASAFPSKNRLENELVQRARVPLEQRAYANYYANPGSAFSEERYPLTQHRNKIALAEGASSSRTPPWLAWCKQDSLRTVPVMTHEKTALLVTSDPSRNKAMTLPGGAFSIQPIQLPTQWNTLMAERGYPPLETFFLKK